jgi:hypothetical protein
VQIGEQHLTGSKEFGLRELRLLDLHDERRFFEEGFFRESEPGTGLPILLV